MKKILILSALQLLLISLKSQIVITEINYNPPETGQDSLEYIEFYNSGLVNVSVKDWVISDAISIIFPDTFIKANSYLVICINQEAFKNTYGFDAIQWTNGALLNSGELITLKDNTGTVIDSVRFFDSNGWPTGPDGLGSSLELCKTTADNSLSEYWKSATRLVGIVLNGYEVRGSPGIANQVACADVSIDIIDFSFKPSEIEIIVGQHVEWKNVSGRHNVNGTKIVFPNNPDDFYSGTPITGNWSYIKRFDLEGVYIYRDDQNPSVTGKITVKKLDPFYPNYSIGLVTTVKADGSLDSSKVRCTIEGIVHGINYRPSGLQFTIIDELNDGINVFNTSQNFGYTVTEGDKIRVKGTIDQFNGLAEILPDSIQIIIANQSLKSANNSTVLNESTESQLIRIKNVSLVNPIQWTNNPLGFTVKVTNGSNVFDIRIDNDCELVNKEAPSGTFDIVGIGYQNDGFIPYTEGYLLYPRYTTDIKPYIPLSKFYNKLDIAKVRTMNSSGELDSLNIRCELRGIVYGIDYDGGNGLQFTLIDKTSGITVFGQNKLFNYNVREGDEIIVQGNIDQFNGQAEIIPDTIILLSENNSLKNPRVVTSLDESSESDLIRLIDFKIEDPVDWKGNGSSFNVRITNGLNSYILRIDDNTDLSSIMIGGDRITVTGLGNQFDQNIPYTEGYQIWPRYKSDVTFITDTKNARQNDELRIVPNPSHQFFYIQDLKEEGTRVELINLQGKIVESHAYSSRIDHKLDPGIYLIKIIYNNGSVVLKLNVY
ncbi:MAG: lamin tail domain-containing protein [Saprospiraceae bacterium]|nr:lamin tail domain-containing protein [Saprospiraceae bacterium]